MDNIALYDILVGSVSKALTTAKSKGRLDLYDLHLLSLFGKLLNDFNSDLTLAQRSCLEEGIRLLQNKNQYICNYKYAEGSAVANVINTKPTVTNASVTFPSLVNSFTATPFTDVFTDANGDSANKVRILSLPTEGTLTYNSATVSVNDEILLSNIALLVYTWTDYTDNTDAFTFQISDNNANNPLFSDMATMTINISATVNQGPSSTGSVTLALDNQAIHTFTSANFTTETSPAYVDPEGDPAESIKVTTLPSEGTLKLSGTAVTLNQIVTITDITAGNLVYESNVSNTASHSVNFDFSISDTGSSSFLTGGNVTFNVAAYVNQPPTIGDVTVAVDEGDVLVITRAMLTTQTVPPYSDPEGNTATTLIVDTLPAAGNLKLNNVNVTAGQNIAFTDIDNSLFTYTQAASAGGTMPLFTFRIIDSAGSISA